MTKEQSDGQTDKRPDPASAASCCQSGVCQECVKKRFQRHAEEMESARGLLGALLNALVIEDFEAMRELCNELSPLLTSVAQCERDARALARIRGDA